MIEANIAGGRLTVSTSALRTNYRHLRHLAGTAECAAVVKADGYGLGIRPVASALYAEGCRTFFVARASEGEALRPLAPDARILVLDGVHTGTVSTLHANGLMPVLGSSDQIGLWERSGQGRPCAVHVDTGMNRLGLGAEEFSALVTGGALKPLDIALLMTHPACADEPAHPLNERQRTAFARARALLPHVPASSCNSAALLTEWPVHDLVRPGIALYGGEAVNDRPPLEPVVSLDARIVQRREIAAGESVGYGATWTAARPSRLAVCAVGYADGYPRSSGTGVPLRHAVAAAGTGAMGGVRVPIVGRISMDLTIFDVTDVPASIAREHDHIELVGPTIPLDEAARSAGTIGYELLTTLGRRYSRYFSER